QLFPGCHPSPPVQIPRPPLPLTPTPLARPTPFASPDPNTTPDLTYVCRLQPTLSICQ
ncbi:MAG: hypothetical protein HC924_15080, partial [Synechococcaceae cyanobacterium SM2_3_2]|nr:hypothetical protein [Synechococcaceae cyanobacterium SM2_3_2]